MSKNVLIVDEDGAFAEIIEAVVGMAFADGQFIKAAKIRTGLDVLFSSQIDLIVSEYSCNDGSSSEIINVNAIHGKVPFILLTDTPKEEMKDIDFSQVHAIVPKVDLPVALENVVSKLSQDGSVFDYIPVPNGLVPHFSFLQTPVSLYQHSRGEFTLALSKGHLFSRLEQAKDSVKKPLAVSKDDLSVWRNFIQDFLSKNGSQKLSVQQLHYIVNSSMKAFDFSDSVTKSVGAVYTDFFESNADDQTFQRFIAKVFSWKNSFISTLGTLAGAISIQLCKAEGLFTPEIAQKLSLAHFFQDLALIDSPLASVARFEQGLEGNLDRDQQTFFHSHPQFAALKVSKLENCPPDVERIILEHHEQFDGFGFPRGMDESSIFKLSKLVIFSNHLALEMIKIKGQGEDVTAEKLVSLMNREDLAATTYQGFFNHLKNGTLGIP